MSVYTRAAATAKRLLTRYGQEGAVVRTERGSGGPSDPTGGQETVTRSSVRLAVFEVGSDRINETNILAGDFQVICEAADVDKGDQIECSEGTLTIKELGKVAPSGELVIFDMVCRK